MDRSPGKGQTDPRGLRAEAEAGTGSHDPGNWGRSRRCARRGSSRRRPQVGAGLWAPPPPPRGPPSRCHESPRSAPEPPSWPPVSVVRRGPHGRQLPALPSHSVATSPALLLTPGTQGAAFTHPSVRRSIHSLLRGPASSYSVPASAPKPRTPRPSEPSVCLKPQNLPARSTSRVAGTRPPCPPWACTHAAWSSDPVPVPDTLGLANPCSAFRCHLPSRPRRGLPLASAQAGSVGSAPPARCCLSRPHGTAQDGEDRVRVTAHPQGSDKETTGPEGVAFAQRCHQTER